SQRALLYLGARQNHCEDKFEDMVLDPQPYTSKAGKQYDGLQAKLAIFILFVVNKINPNFCVSRLYYSGIDAKLTR
ncbi:DUF2982 domain-containing protein, partial [Vibrio parahaemolyticus]|uniref:DUF2982 domain-containing protein n=1 Tax=Vibrio parahaemolyticus TaxID=670 RepID=UPI001121EC5A